MAGKFCQLFVICRAIWEPFVHILFLQIMTVLPVGGTIYEFDYKQNISCIDNCTHLFCHSRALAGFLA
jgi:hypothetical protein